MEQNNLYNIRNYLSYLLAGAVLSFYPDAKLATGLSIDNGFYYDFDFPSPISKNDLEKIENKMREILKTWKKFEGKEISGKDAKEFFKNNEYKIELIEEFNKAEETISLYTSGNFTDLRIGGHISDANDIKSGSWKRDRLAGAYWRGDEKNKMLTRIYGLAFESKAELEEYLQMRAEAQKRDHRKLGRQLGLFTFSELVGSGLPLYTPKGALIRRLLNEYIEELQTKAGYTQVWTPQMSRAELFKISGHYDKYHDSMFRVVS